MRPLTRTKTATKNKEMNSSRLSLNSLDISPIELRLETLEKLINQLTSQNESLSKRIEELESRSTKSLQKSNSYKSLTTMNNTLIDQDNTLVDEFSVSVSYPKSAEPAKYLMNDFNSNEMTEWKKNIEKTIEKISEKIFSRNSNVYSSLLEKKIEEVSGEFNIIKNQIQLINENENLVKKNLDNFEKTEKIISTLFNQITDMKCNNIKWQKEILASINEFNEKFSNQENSIENYEMFEKSVNNKIEHMEKQIKRLLNKDDKKDDKKFEDIEDKIRFVEEMQKNYFEKNQNMNEKLNGDIVKIEVSCKALWDSFTLFTSTFDRYDYQVY